MNACDHHTWLQISYAKEPVISDTGRLVRLLRELQNPAQQEPTLIFFVGRKAKDEALRALFPWNNVKKGGRDGIASLRVDTTTIQSRHPILFAESDPSSSVTSYSETLLSCHRAKTFPIEWANNGLDNIFDLVHGRLFCMFADVLCIFADDFTSFEEVVARLEAWTSFGKPSDQMDSVRPSVIIVKKGKGSSQSTTYDLLERLDVELSLLQREFVEFFSAIIVLQLADEQISSISRHRRLKELIRRQVAIQRQLRQSHGCSYNAIHMSHFFTEAVSHTARTVNERYNFLLAARQEIVQTTTFLAEFFQFCVRHHFMNDAAFTYVASTMLVDAYPHGMHKFDPTYIYECMYQQSCVDALELSGSNRLNARVESESILDHFTNLFSEMHNRNKTASELHRFTMAAPAFPWGLFHSNKTCLHCLRRKPETVLTYSHSICDACVHTFGAPLAFTEYQYCIDECLLCHSGSLNVILHPPTAGYRLLSVDGGGIRGVIPLEFLKHLQEYIGSACRIQDLFDLAIGTSPGGLVVLGVFIRQWSVTQCARNFDTLTKKFFHDQDRRRGGLFRYIRRMLKCWMSDAYYDATRFEMTLRQVFGERTRMFDSRPSPSSAKVAVTATTISDAMPFVFSNYNGVSDRQKDTGYQHLRPSKSEDELRVWEAARATSAAPMLFQPAWIPSIGTFQDGGLKHNNPINLALWESRHIWPALERPDVVVSLGTGMAKDPTTPTAPNFRHVIHNGFIPRLWRSFMSSLDGQSIWREIWNRLETGSRHDFFRLNVKLTGEGPAMDDVGRMEELRECVRQQVNDESSCDKTAFALIVSAFFFELSSVPLFYGGLYYCKGTVRCRIPGNAICQTFERLHESRLAFMTDDEILGHFLSYEDLCAKCNRYTKDVEFIVRHPADTISIYLQSPQQGKRRLSAFPQTIEWFIQQQRLEARFALVGQLEDKSCDGCRASKLSRLHSAMPKRKMTEHPNENPRSQKRPRLTTALSPWERG